MKMSAAVKVAAVLVASSLGALGCARKECAEMFVQAVDPAAMCLGPAMPGAGLLLCHDPDEPQGKGLFPVCLVDPSGALFVAWTGSTVWIEASGWTHGWPPRSPSTLSAEAEARCADAPNPGAWPACP